MVYELELLNNIKHGCHGCTYMLKIERKRGKKRKRGEWGWVEVEVQGHSEDGGDLKGLASENNLFGFLPVS